LSIPGLIGKRDCWTSPSLLIVSGHSFSCGYPGYAHGVPSETMEMTNMSFLVNQDDSVRFNQIKGRNMTGYFTNNELNKMFVIGNGQTIYFARDKGIMVGVQKCESTDITLLFNKPKLGKMTLQRITYKNTVAGIFHPPLELKGNDLVLKDFEWLEDDRPKVWRDVFIWEENQ